MLTGYGNRSHRDTHAPEDQQGDASARDRSRDYLGRRMGFYYVARQTERCQVEEDKQPENSAWRYLEGSQEDDGQRGVAHEVKTYLPEGRDGQGDYTERKAAKHAGQEYARPGEEVEDKASGGRVHDAEDKGPCAFLASGNVPVTDAATAAPPDEVGQGDDS